MPKTDAAVTGELQKLAPELVAIVTAMPLPELDVGPLHAPLAKWLKTDAGALNELQKCGLLLLSGQLDASHEISQSIHSPEGSFWHGIMHRREGDFWNAKYWFRKVGKHPVLAHLAETKYGDGSVFVDRVEQAIQSHTPDLQACRELQWKEWQALFRHTL